MSLSCELEVQCAPVQLDCSKQTRRREEVTSEQSGKCGVPPQIPSKPSTNSLISSTCQNSLPLTMGTPTSMIHGAHASVRGQVGCAVKKPDSSPALSCEQSEEGKANTRLFCSLCKIAVNSPSQLLEHNRGTKHKTILEARSGRGPIKSYPRLCFTSSLSHSSQERTFHCEICNVRVNSEPQLKQHISSRRHRDAVAGKSNPLKNRHKSLSSAESMYTLLFPKDLPKPLSYSLLPSPLVVAAAATSSSQFALCTLGPSPHPYLPIIHTTQLNQTVIQPSLKPIFSSHRPLLFSPY